MSVRRLLRGQVSWATLEGVARELGERYDLPTVRVTFIEADNWLSTPLVVNDEWFVKVVSDQHTLVHGLLTTGRNLGAFTSGGEGFFEGFDTPVEMAEHELVATRRMRELGANAPEPVEAFEYDGHGVLVLEYLPSFRTLDDLSAAQADRVAPSLYENLARLHGAGLAHGDLRAENVLLSEGEVYFIDATRVDPAAIEGARAYDLACALAALAPLVGARAAVAAALTVYSVDDLLLAEDFLDFVKLRPDHDFDAGRVKGEIEKAAS